MPVKNVNNANKPVSDGHVSGKLWCGVAQLVARRLAVRQAQVRFSAWHHREVFPAEHTCYDSYEEMGEASANCNGYMYCMNVIVGMYVYML